VPTVPFRPDAWNRIDHPPYAGQWWAVTRHRTVELVDVDLKDPDHLLKPELGEADTIGEHPVDPYVYKYGQGCTENTEVLGRRRWTHWMPVLPPAPPLDFDPVASGLADPTPGPRVASFRRDPGHGDPPGPRGTVGRARKRIDEELERLDREDASAYKPVDLPPGDAAWEPAGGGEGADPMPPADLMERVKVLAEYIIGLGGVAREREYARLRAANPVVFTLLRAFVNELRHERGEDRAA